MRTFCESLSISLNGLLCRSDAPVIPDSESRSNVQHVHMSLSSHDGVFVSVFPFICLSFSTVRSQQHFTLTRNKILQMLQQVKHVEIVSSLLSS